ncbi:MAG: hypothetical protein ACRECW_08925 [Phyllobacterium sp.]
MTRKNEPHQEVAQKSATMAATLKSSGTSRNIDGYLKAMGVTLAAGCALLPFAMYFETLQSKLSRPAPVESQIRDPLDRSKQKVFLTGRDKAFERPNAAKDDVDPIQTATTSRVVSSEDAAKRERAKDQPYPDAPVYLLREVVGGLAMIEDDAGYWFVEKGSHLPDGTTVEKITQSAANGIWQITTSAGAVVPLTK